MLETVPDIVYSVNSALGFALIAIAAKTSGPLRESSLHLNGSFWLFAGFNFLSIIYTLSFVKETRGLTDIEKKSLYSSSPELAAVETGQTEEKDRLNDTIERSIGSRVGSDSLIFEDGRGGISPDSLLVTEHDD